LVKLGKSQRSIVVNPLPQLPTSKPQFYAQDR
jgi:hypothetical protein